MFKIQNNVPSVYINESRDFQVLCRLYDCWHGAQKFFIDSIQNILDPKLVLNEYLTLLCTRVGFFTTEHIDSNVLRNIISAFPYIIRNKGNKRGIVQAVNCILKAENNSTSTVPVNVVIDNTTHTIGIYTSNDIYNKTALSELLRYVLPFGYTYTLYTYVEATPIIDTVYVKNNINKDIVDTIDLGSIRGMKDEVTVSDVGTYNTSMIIGLNN